MEQCIYYKDMLLLMSALDQPYKPDVSDVFDNGASTPGIKRVNLSENNLTQIGDICY